jgi:hypothetical protein
VSITPVQVCSGATSVTLYLLTTAAANTATAMLEVQVQADGTPGTFIQQEITLRRDLVLP